MNLPTQISRRGFLRTAAGAAAFASIPTVIPSRLLGANAPSNRLRLGQIGAGRIARVHDIPAVLAADLGDYVAICDLDSRRLAEGRALIEQSTAGGPPVPAVSAYGDYRELIARSDIDAVVISTPDHWHAELAMAAVLAGKDLYLQKPMTMTIEEGILLRDAVQAHGRVFQLGSQQRSTSQFRLACELVRSGRVGRLRRVEIGLPLDPTAPDQPEESVPRNLDYDRWLGPTPRAYYTEQRVHPQKGYDRPGWMRNDAFCLGMITGWGAHHFDIAHWGMDLELSGPYRVEGTADFPRNKIWNVHGAYHVELMYPGEIRLTVSNTFENGIRFFGDDGWIFVSRGEADATSQRVSKALDASRPALLDAKGLTVRLPRSREHHRNFLECVRSRAATMSPAPIAHRANTACVVSWIAMKLGRPLRWDVKAERFVGDPGADAMLSRPERAPYGVHRLLSA
ncbi:MAG: Gfo/Idh/MocA family oxidoreductase [Opitutaceae bacterium]